MQRTPVGSSTISSIGYDADSATLEVEFINGSVYQYFGVPEDVFNGVLAAPSKGQYFNEYIKKAGYPCTRA